MGCDIHMFTETKKSINSIEKWVNVDDFRPNPITPNRHIPLTLQFIGCGCVTKTEFV